MIWLLMKDFTTYVLQGLIKTFCANVLCVRACECVVGHIEIFADLCLHVFTGQFSQKYISSSCFKDI